MLYIRSFLYRMEDEIKREATKDATREATKESTKSVAEATAKVKIEVENAKNAAKTAADEAVDIAIREVLQKKQIDEEISSSIDKQMNRVSKHITETSVTILGIFAGIVLTVVAGLFYSSAVMESVKDAHICRLVIAGSLVGLVGVNLIAIMFIYIDKLRTTVDKEAAFLKDLPWKLNWLLVAIMFIFLIVHFVFCRDLPEENQRQECEETQSIEILIVPELG